ncbi:mRNA interferase MqsR [bacterium BMS3Bbin09]|nr:mRNA interferase MqsR [bacterium BMS3Bbin09]HDH34687.1 type II toxin-antitoxin system MqsR family toxin [Nitrospirota bacterium]
MNIRPTYDLKKLKKLIANEETRHFTKTSIVNAFGLGFSVTEIIDVILSLENSNFYKTMPKRDCVGIWQDVYHSTGKGFDLYIKLQETPKNTGVIINFKQK